MNICVFGAASDNIAAHYMNEAAKLGRLIAERGHGMIFGGGSHGIMGASARAALDAGGTVVGVSPGFFEAAGVLEKRCTQLVITDDIRGRLREMQERSDAFVALPGGVGTFDELLEMLMLRQIGRMDKPIAVLNTNGYYAPLMAALENAAEQGFMNHECIDLVHLCDTPEQVVDYFEAAYIA